MVELGIAIGLRKPTFLYRDDFRTCTKTEDYLLNLMCFVGLPQDGWRDYFTRRSPSSPTRRRRSRGGSPARMWPAALRGA